MLRDTGACRYGPQLVCSKLPHVPLGLCLRSRCSQSRRTRRVGTDIGRAPASQMERALCKLLDAIASVERNVEFRRPGLGALSDFPPRLPRRFIAPDFDDIAPHGLDRVRSYRNVDATSCFLARATIVANAATEASRSSKFFASEYPAMMITLSSLEVLAKPNKPL